MVYVYKKINQNETFMDDFQKKLVRVTKNDTHICILLKKVTLEKSFLESLSIFCGTM